MFVVCGVSTIEQSPFALVLSFNFIFQFILENFKCFLVKYMRANGKNLAEPSKLSSFKLKYIQIIGLVLVARNLSNKRHFPGYLHINYCGLFFIAISKCSQS